MIAIRFDHGTVSDGTPDKTDYGDVVWLYCPVDSTEEIEFIWMLYGSCSASGLVVSDPHGATPLILMLSGKNKPKMHVVVHLL